MWFVFLFQPFFQHIQSTQLAYSQIHLKFHPHVQQRFMLSQRGSFRVRRSKRRTLDLATIKSSRQAPLHPIQDPE